MLNVSIDRIYQFFLMMQLIAIIPIYRTKIPANVEGLLEEFSKVVKFEYLKPDVLINFISPGTTIASLLGDAKIGS